MYSLRIYGQETSFNFEEGEKLLDLLQDRGIIMESPCGGKGYCGKCKIQILEGEVNDLNEEEEKHLTKAEIEKGIRLSCFIYPKSDILIKLLNKGRVKHKILSEGYMPEVNLNPNVKKKVVELKKPTLDNNISYEELLEEVLGRGIDFQTPMFLDCLSKAYKEDKATIIYYDDEVIGIEAGDTSDKLYAVAVDIGTTTVVAALIDLNTGDEISSETSINPQKEYGLDVLSRIDFIKRKENGLKLLHMTIVDCLNSLLENLCLKNNIHKEDMYEISVGANATMMHILLNIDTYAIGKSPYATIFCRQKKLWASSIGINISSFGKLYCLPGVSSYIGADITAGVMVADLKNTKENVLFIDIGTNGEIVLSKGGKLSSCSCAAGPALEGANISCGMRAAEGAIEGIEIGENGIKLQVIGEEEPIGICGSGILEGISEIWKNGLINKSGRLKKSEELEREERVVLANTLKEEDKKRKLYIYKDICITQEDIRQVQLAKGAISSGFFALLELMDVSMEELHSVIIAGQFGKHLKIDSLIGVGIIPESLRDKVKYIGNSSKTGAVMCLLSKEKREEIESVAKNIRYFELSTKEGYEKLFAKCLSFN